MLWAAALGFLTGSGGASPHVASLVILGGVGAKGGLEVVRFTTWGTETPYALYAQELRKAGSLPARPWVGYMAQMIGWGALIGGVVYVVTRSLW